MTNKTMYFLTFLFFGSAMVGFSACKKDSKEPDTVTAGTASATIVVEGTTIPFSSIKDSSVAFLETIPGEDVMAFSMVLKDDNSRTLIEMMIMPVSEGAGTYPMADGFGEDSLSRSGVFLQGRGSARADTYGPVWISHDGELTQSSGTLQIASMTATRATGTFNAVLYSYNNDTKVIKELKITNGAFDVPLVRREMDM